MSDLASLIERIEQAERSDQHAMLREAFEAVNGPVQTQTRGGTVRFHADWFAFERMLRANAFESAALTLVPEGWIALISVYPDAGEALLHDDRVNPVRLPSQEADAATPALALCAAALKARQS